MPGQDAATSEKGRGRFLPSTRTHSNEIQFGAGTTAAGIDGEGHIDHALDDDDATLIDVATGQLLALFRYLAPGQRPDAPSLGVLTRVVPPFRTHPEHADRRRADTVQVANGHAIGSAAGRAGMEPAPGIIAVTGFNTAACRSTSPRRNRAARIAARRGERLRLFFETDRGIS